MGQKTPDEAEITSGLSAGQNVVYTRTFTGRFPGASGQFNGYRSGGQGGFRRAAVQGGGPPRRRPPPTAPSNGA